MNQEQEDFIDTFRLLWPSSQKKTTVKLKEENLILEFSGGKLCRQKKPLIIPFDLLLEIESKTSKRQADSITFVDTDFRFIGNGTKNTQKVFDKILDVSITFLIESRNLRIESLYYYFSFL